MGLQNDELLFSVLVAWHMRGLMVGNHRGTGLQCLTPESYIIMLVPLLSIVVFVADPQFWTQTFSAECHLLLLTFARGRFEVTQLV